MSVQRFRKIATVLAERQTLGGQVVTPEGVMSYEAGDYLVTDNPPTHVWPVKRAIFEATHEQDPYAPEDDLLNRFRAMLVRFKE